MSTDATKSHEESPRERLQLVSTVTLDEAIRSLFDPTVVRCPGGSRGRWRSSAPDPRRVA